jgi:MEDS: MEthanogen/methylotroph, DcmR Sensory domain/STAS domain
VRHSGVIELVRGFGPHDHLCWAYDDPAAFRSRAREFLSEGLAQGLRVGYVAEGDGGELRDLGEAVRIESLEARYPAHTVIDPAGQAEAYATATEDALTDGFAGLRVVADVTRLVRSAEQLDAFARYEHLVDRYMAGRPFSALCAYDLKELGEDTIAQLAGLHPVANTEASRFRLHAPADPALGDLSLSGELDLLSRELFPLALDRAVPDAAGGEVVVDATGLEFMDHNHLLALDDLAHRRKTTIVLRTAASTPGRLARILDLRNVRVESAV